MRNFSVFVLSESDENNFFCYVKDREKLRFNGRETMGKISVACKGGLLTLAGIAALGCSAGLYPLSGIRETTDM